MSGIISDFSTDRWMQREKQLAKNVGQLAINSKSIEVDTKENLVVRSILPAQDLNSGADNGWEDSTGGSTTEEWQQDFNSSGSADSYNEAYKIDSADLAEDKVFGIMGISALHGNVQTHQIRMSLGQGGNQGVKREYQVEPLETDEEGRAMFLTDVIFDASEHGVIEHYTESADDGLRMVYHGYVAEPVGETLAEANNPLLAGSGGAGPSGRRR